MRHLLALAVILCHRLSFVGVPRDAAQPSSVLSTLDARHPRLMLKDVDLGRLRASYSDDPALQKCWQDACRGRQ